MKELKTEVSKFYKEIASWITLYDDLNESLKVYLFLFLLCKSAFQIKDLGDVVNWSSVIERDFKNVIDKLQLMKESKDTHPPAQTDKPNAENQCNFYKLSIQRTKTYKFDMITQGIRLRQRLI